jgi:hypothetical protein
MIGTNKSGKKRSCWPGNSPAKSSGRRRQWRCLRIANVSDARRRDGRSHAGGSHKTTQKCVTDIDLDINVHVHKLR